MAEEITFIEEAQKYEDSLKNNIPFQKNTKLRVKIILMKDARKIVRFLQCFSGGKCRFNILKTIRAESKNYVPREYLLVTRLYRK